MEILVGCSGFPYSKRHYYKNFNFVEYEDTYKSFAKKRTLEKMRETSGENFSFAVKAPLFISDNVEFIKKFSNNVPQIETENIEQYGLFKDTPQNNKLTDLLFTQVEQLKGDAIIFYTSNKVYPAPQTMKNMNAYFKKIEERTKDIDLFWHCFGFWDKDSINEAIAGTKVVPAYDPLMDEDLGNFDVNYYVMRGLGNYAKGYSSEALEDLYNLIMRKSVDTYVVFQGPNQALDAKNFLELLTH